jgi:hypothetical protein
MCLGFGVWIKPTALLFGAALWWLAWRDRGDRGDRRRGLRTAFALGALAVSAGMTLWLAASGGLGPFVALMREFVGPVYQNLSERPFAESLRMRAHVLVPCCLCLVAGALARRKDARDRVLLAGCVYGLAHILLQRKLFFYHLYPLAGFSCALAATWLRGSLLEVCTPRALARTAAVAAFAAWLGFWPARLNPSTYQASIVSSVYDGMTADLRARVTPRSRVQVLDTASGGLAALMRLDMRNATPYIYDFPFFQGGRAPVLLRMRADFLRRMEASPPDVIVFARYGWPRGQYERIAAFPELAAWMRAHYRLDVERVHYRIYVKRA